MESYENLKEVQHRLLEMAVSIKAIFEKHNIKYFITYGTLLGAVRHKGFIPWDDDFDFYLFDEDYDEAIEILRRELPHDLFLEDEKSEPLYFHGWIHVKDLKSYAEYTLYPQDEIYSHKGISVDIYRAYKIDFNAEKAFRIKKHIEYLNRRYSKGAIEETEYRSRISDLETQLSKENEMQFSEGKAVYTFPSIYNDRIFPEEMFPLRPYLFNGYYFLGPNDADAFLKRCYGNYMALPPEDKRHPHYSSVKFII